MNTDRVQQIINGIIQDYRANAYKGGRNQYPASKKYLARAEELGILDMIPNAPYSKHIGNSEIQAVLQAAEDAGREVGGFNEYGEGDVTTTPPHPLHVALNEPDTVEAEADSMKHEITFEVRTDCLFDAVWAFQTTDSHIIASGSGPCDLTLFLAPGEYVEVFTATNYTNGRTATERRFTVTTDGKVAYQPNPRSLPLSALI